MNPARDLGPRFVTALAGWGTVAAEAAWVYTLGPIAGAISGASGYVMDGFRVQLEEAAAEAAHGAKLFAHAMDEASDDALEMRDELDELLPTLYENTTDLLAEIADSLDGMLGQEPMPIIERLEMMAKAAAEKKAREGK